MNELQTSNGKIQSKSQEIDPKSKKPKIYNMRERLLVFSKRILFICRSLPKVPECEGIRRQLARAATSVGANFEEADGALSKRDFINKVGISRKEAKEAKYWLCLINETIFEKGRVDDDIQESWEIIKILSAMLINSGKKRRD